MDVMKLTGGATVPASRLQLAQGTVATQCGLIRPVSLYSQLHRRECMECMRTVHVNATKETYLESMRDVKTGRKVKPLMRAAADVDLSAMVQGCTKWQQVKQLFDEMSDRFERNPSLMVGAVVKLSELMTDAKSVTPKSKASCLKFVDVICVAATNKLDRVRGDDCISLLCALQEMKHPSPKLANAVLGCLEGGASRFPVAQLLSITVSLVQMGHKPSASCVAAITEQANRSMKYVTADDISNAAFAFSRLSGFPPSYAVRLSMAATAHLADMSGDALANLLLLLSKVPNFNVMPYWSDTFMDHISTKLKGIRDIRSYPALLYGLSRLAMPLPDFLLDEVTSALSKAPQAAVRGGKRSTAPPPLLQLEAEDLAVVISVVAHTYHAFGYEPSEVFTEKCFEALEEKAGSMDAMSAAAAVTAFPTMLSAAQLKPATFIDLLDELLAVSESGLPKLGASMLEGMAQALEELAEAGYSPDSFWMDAMREELMVRVSSKAGEKRSDPDAVGVEQKSNSLVAVSELLTLAGAMAALCALSSEAVPAAGASGKKGKAAASPAAAFAIKLVERVTEHGTVSLVDHETLCTRIVEMGLNTKDYPIPEPNRLDLADVFGSLPKPGFIPVYDRMDKMETEDELWGASSQSQQQQSSMGSAWPRASQPRQSTAFELAGDGGFDDLWEEEPHGFAAASPRGLRAYRGDREPVRSFQGGMSFRARAQGDYSSWGAGTEAAEPFGWDAREMPAQQEGHRSGAGRDDGQGWGQQQQQRSRQRYDGQQYDEQQYDEQQYDEQQYIGQQYSEQQYSEQRYNNQQYIGQHYDEQQYNNQQYSGQQYNEQHYNNQQYSREQYSKQHYSGQQYNELQYNRQQYNEQHYGGQQNMQEPRQQWYQQSDSFDPFLQAGAEAGPFHQPGNNFDPFLQAGAEADPFLPATARSASPTWSSSATSQPASATKRESEAYTSIGGRPVSAPSRSQAINSVPSSPPQDQEPAYPTPAAAAAEVDAPLVTSTRQRKARGTAAAADPPPSPKDLVASSTKVTRSKRTPKAKPSAKGDDYLDFDF